MSFGASPSDIIIVVTFCKTLYRACRSASGEYDEISREVKALHVVLRHLKYEVEAPDSPLNRDASLWGRQLAPIIGDCDYTLRQLDGLLAKYGRLAAGSGGGNSPSSPRMLWDRMKFGSNEMDQLGVIRVKLISHKTSLTLFLDTIQLHQSGKMATTLDNHGGQLDVILDKVDKIATKMHQKNGSVMTNYDDDDKEVWKDFRRELVKEGFSSDILQQHKDVLRAYIREIEQQGLLDSSRADPVLPAPPVAQHTERWLENVQTPPALPSTSSSGLQSFDSEDLSIEDAGPKVVLNQEENMKFPQSMKLQRAKPESIKDIPRPRRQLAPPEDYEPTSERRASGGSQRQPSPVPRLVTSDTKDQYYINTDGSSESDSHSSTDNSLERVRSKSPSYGQIITTSNLIAMSQALTVHPHSPSSFRSQNSYFDDAVPRTIAHRTKQQQEQSSQTPGAIAIPNNKTGDRLGTTPGPDPVHLAPDSKGNTIQPDAKWTKISRRLISPEVLDQAHKRYEARPDFVAVLGVLSRAEIQDLAARSHDLREARRKRHFPPEVPPPQPPRPVSNQRPRARAISSDDEGYSSDSDRDLRRQKPLKGILKKNYTHQHYQQAPPSPAWSPTTSDRQAAYIPRENERDREREIDRQREKERDREPRRHRHNHYHDRDKERIIPEREREREREREKQKKKKLINGENLTFAGIGGAAASLLHVLSDAAEGL